MYLLRVPFFNMMVFFLFTLSFLCLYVFTDANSDESDWWDTLGISKFATFGQHRVAL